MFNEAYNSTNEKKTTLVTADLLREYEACMRTKEGNRVNMVGGLVGAAIASLVCGVLKPELVKNKVVAWFLIGGLVGYQGSKYVQAKECFIKTFRKNQSGIQEHELGRLVLRTDLSDVNIYENGKNGLKRSVHAERDTSPAITKESILDIESPPLDESPVINESIGVPRNKQPGRTVTYKELRQRNREAYMARNNLEKPQMSQEQSEEQPMQTKEFETESMESNLFLEQSTGKRKTKYGDVWD